MTFSGWWAHSPTLSADGANRSSTDRGSAEGGAAGAAGADGAGEDDESVTTVEVWTWKAGAPEEAPGDFESALTYGEEIWAKLQMMNCDYFSCLL